MHPRRKGWWPVLFVATLACSLSLPARAEDSITLQNGEVMRGRILSETDQQIEIEVANADRTIRVTREIARAEVKSVQRETPEQAAERKAFESLIRYKLNADSAYPTNYYPAVIAVMENFLATYPRSEYAGQIGELLAGWKAEFPQAVQAAQKGLVKYHGQWMSPEAALALAQEERRKNDEVRRQREEARRRQIEETSRLQQQQQQQDQSGNQSSSPTPAPRGGRYDVEIPHVLPYQP